MLTPRVAVLPVANTVARLYAPIATAFPCIAIAIAPALKAEIPIAIFSINNLTAAAAT